MTRFVIVFLILTISKGKDYEPNWSSLDSRPTPEWFKDAKFGIFIHWGLYSVPAWGPKGSYAEWYLNGLNNGDTARLRYHEKNYGKDFPYRDFIDYFDAAKFDPGDWANLFKRAGAKYVVLTSKHHDGFCLWPSPQSRGYNSVNGIAKRDLLGDLDHAVKKLGLRSGFYYSLYEWDHPDYPKNVIRYVDEHMLPQLKDAVQRYEPDIIFSDGEWDRDSREWKSEKFLAWLYNESNAPKDVVVNDRWGGETRFKHGGYFSTEYDPSSGHINDDFIERGWEECRGMGRSFGYNKNEGLNDYSSSDDLIRLLVDIVSRGGNLLLNIGPRSDGTIPKIMANRLIEIGDWLDVNGESIYGTTINPIARSGDIRFTLSKDRRYLFAFIEKVPKKRMTIKNINANGNEQITLLGSKSKLTWRNVRNDLLIDIPKKLRPAFSSFPIHVLKIPVLPYLDPPTIKIEIEDERANINITSNHTSVKLEYGFGDETEALKANNEYIGPFQINVPGTLVAQSSAQGYRTSKLATMPVEILSTKNGLTKSTYLGQWNDCREMMKETPFLRTRVNNFIIDDYRENDFGHAFTGYLNVETEGNYSFQTTSDDGSRLYIGDFPLVDNDGLHGRKTVSSDIPLQKGRYKIEVQYFERGGQESLEVKWKGPGFDWMSIPSYRLFIDKN